MIERGENNHFVQDLKFVLLCCSCSWVYFIKMYLFIYPWLCWVFVPVHGLSLVVASGGYHLGVVRGRLTAVASLIAEHRLWSTQASVVGVHRLSSLAPGL